MRKSNGIIYFLRTALGLVGACFFVILTSCSMQLELTNGESENLPKKVKTNFETSENAFTNNPAIPLKFIMSKAVDDLTASNFLTTNSKIENFKVLGSVVTFDLVALNEGSIKVVLLEQEVTCSGKEALLLGSEISFTYDKTPPMFYAEDSLIAVGNKNIEFKWTVVFSGADLIPFNASHVTLTGEIQGCSVTVGNGTAAHKRIVTVKGCTGDNKMRFGISEGAALDLAGNLSKALVNVGNAVTVDNTPPKITVSEPSVLIGDQSTEFRWNINFQDARTVALSPSHINLVGVFEGCVKSIEGSGFALRTLVVKNCTGDGSLGFTILPGAIADLATNSSLEVTSGITAVTVDNSGSGLLATGPDSNGGMSSKPSWGGKSGGSSRTSAREEILDSVPDGLESFDAFVSGEGFTCALLKDVGTLYCWGRNSEGQFGIGSVGTSSTPVLAAQGMSFSKIAAGKRHLCGIRKDSSELMCWGDNSKGQVSSSLEGLQLKPVLIDSGVVYSDVFAEASYSCAVLLLTGKQNCWGSVEH